MNELYEPALSALSEEIAEVETRIRQLTYSVGFLGPAGGLRQCDLSEPEEGALTMLNKELSAAKQRLSDLMFLYRTRN